MSRLRLEDWACSISNTVIILWHVKEITECFSDVCHRLWSSSLLIAAVRAPSLPVRIALNVYRLCSSLSSGMWQKLAEKVCADGTPVLPGLIFVYTAAWLGNSLFLGLHSLSAMDPWALIKSYVGCVLTLCCIWLIPEECGWCLHLQKLRKWCYFEVYASHTIMVMSFHTQSTDGGFYGF